MISHQGSRNQKTTKGDGSMDKVLKTYMIWILETYMGERIDS